DPTAAILDYADSHDMQVFVGLAMEDAWWKRAADPDYLDHAAAQSIGIAKEAWTRYGRHRSLAGWYIPQETWDADYPADQIARLRAFFRRVSDACKSLSGGKPVSTAPFFSGSVKPEAVERVYASLLP